MDIQTELRKLNAGNLFTLVQILEYDESWKRLMAIIPKSLTLENYESRIAINNLPKYNTEHFKLIENAGYKLRKPCSEILFEEWGTSGQIRPTLGHLLKLLERAELYRAADYVAVDLLKVPPPERPLTGPAARVNTSFEDNSVNIPTQNTTAEVQRLLDQISYPSSLLNSNATNFANMNQNGQHAKLIIPKIVVSEVSSIVDNNEVANERTMTTRSNNASDNTSAATSMIQREMILERKIKQLRYSPQIPENITESTEIDSSSSASDMIQFSEENQIPNITLLNRSSGSETNSSSISRSVSDSSGNLPDFNNIFPNSRSSDTYNSDSSNTPAFSQILDRNSNNTGSNVHSDSDIVPAFSKIMDTDTNIRASNEHYIPALTDMQNSEFNIPAMSKLLNSDNNMPAFSQIMNSSSSGDSKELNSTNNIPDLSQIMLRSGSNDSANGIPVFDQLMSNATDEHNQQNMSGRMPALSDLLLSNPAHQTNSEINSGFLPNITVFQPSSDKINSLETTMTRKISLSPSIPSRTTCASPLPNLSLNTVLPHFTYVELELCTGGFDETVLDSQHSIYENEPIGRKLGSGAFGSVYLGIGLLDKPVAVKKLNLDGVNVVNVDDTITKQFRNEVELLCKYKHDNLLSLLGYSCDGPTYCLIYEYICGGALKDRLQSTENRLVWTDRLYIALGTARAVSYLHNAHSMPLIHRDIKSANILLDNASKPKLCDFGLIKLTPNQNTNTSTTVFGTSAYMAPEAFRGDVSVKLDTFSFGVVLLELITGLPPLDENREGNDLVTHVEEVCEDGIKPLLDTKAGSWLLADTQFGEQLYEIAMQCLEEKKRRPVMADIVVQLSLLIDKTSNSP